RPRRARGERDVEVVGVGVRRRDEAARPLEPGLREVLVLDAIPLDEERARLTRRLDRVLAEVEDDERHAVRPELLRHAAADAAVAADDEVVLQSLDRPLPPSLGERAGDGVARDGLDDSG